MTERNTISNSNRKGPEQGATLLLVLLLSADMMFIAVHTAYRLAPLFDNPLHSLDREMGYPELFQYIKWLWVVILLLYMMVSNRSLRYAAWGLLFAFLLADDVFMLHEVWGSRLAPLLTGIFITGLRKQDIGELLVLAMVILALLIPVWLACRNGSASFRRMSADLFLLLLILFFFGVILDPVHAVLRSNPAAEFILGVAEDGGEMVAASFIVWYVFRQCAREADFGISMKKGMFRGFDRGKDDRVNDP
ncbi:MAG: hypothetical protein ACP5D1_07795 [Bacteroidales bacterium]